MELVGNPAGEDRLVSVYQKLCITYRGFRFHLVKKGASEPFQLVSTMSRVRPWKTNLRTIGKICCNVKREVGVELEHYSYSPESR